MKIQENKYLIDLGIPVEKQGMNTVYKDLSEEDDRYKYFMEQREEYGFDDAETWNLDKMFIEWLYNHLKMYKEIGGEVVDLSVKTYEIFGEVKNQEEWIDYIIYVLGQAIRCYTFGTYEYNYNEVEKAIAVWSKIYADCWW